MGAPLPGTVVWRLTELAIFARLDFERFPSETCDLLHGLMGWTVLTRSDAVVHG